MKTKTTELPIVFALQFVVTEAIIFYRYARPGSGEWGGRDTDALHPRELADRTEQKTVQRGNLGDVSLLEIRLVSAVGIFLSIKKKR